MVFLPFHKMQQYKSSEELVILTINKPTAVTSQYYSWRTNNNGKAIRGFIDGVYLKLAVTQNLLQGRF